MDKFKSKKLEPILCKVCGQPLKSSVCVTCWGTGISKDAFAGRTSCKTCGGKGRLYQCPNSNMHWMYLKKTIGPLSKPTTFSTKPVHQVCPTCKGTKGIRLPMTGQAVQCPRCKGKGWV